MMVCKHQEHLIALYLADARRLGGLLRIGRTEQIALDLHTMIAVGRDGRRREGVAQGSV